MFVLGLIKAASLILELQTDIYAQPLFILNVIFFFLFSFFSLYVGAVVGSQ